MDLFCHYGHPWEKYCYNFYCIKNYNKLVFSDTRKFFRYNNHTSQILISTIRILCLHLEVASFRTIIIFKWTSLLNGLKFLSKNPVLCACAYSFVCSWEDVDGPALLKEACPWALALRAEGLPRLQFVLSASCFRWKMWALGFMFLPPAAMLSLPLWNTLEL